MASVGVTSGVAFCGVVGSAGNRREYTVLGDVVNLAARLMQHAGRTGVQVLVDEPTAYASRSVLAFEELPSITVRPACGASLVLLLLLLMLLLLLLS